MQSKIVWVQHKVTSTAKNVFHRGKAHSAANSEIGDPETTWPQIKQEILLWLPLGMDWLNRRTGLCRGLGNTPALVRPPAFGAAGPLQGCGEERDVGDVR